MKAALQSLAPLTGMPITRCLLNPIPDRRLKSFNIETCSNFGKPVNQSQYYNQNTVASIVVADSGHHCFEIADVEESMDRTPVRTIKDNIIKKMKNYEGFTPFENCGRAMYSLGDVDSMSKRSIRY